MKKKFISKIREINNIGDELRFQREYYNFKHSSEKLIPRIAKGKSKSVFLGDVLQDFLDTNFEYMMTPKKTIRENYGEYGTGEDLLYAIEHNKLKSNRYKKKEKYNPNAYYLRMYSLFKIYGFLSDYDILLTLRRHNIKPRFEKSKIEIEKIIYKIKQKRRENGNNVLFDWRTCEIDTLPKTIEKFKNELNSDKKTLNFICDDKNKIKNGIITLSPLKFTNIKKIIVDKLKLIPKLDRMCISLDIGQRCSFLDEIINNQIETTTMITLFKVIEVTKLQNTDFGYIVNNRINDTEENVNWNKVVLGDYKNLI